jgi:hypothetical protein
VADRTVNAGFQRIADFRRDNGPAIRAVCSQFVALCRGLNLFTQAVVAIDGSKFTAVNNRDKNYTVAKVKKHIEQVDAASPTTLTISSCGRSNAPASACSAPTPAALRRARR